MLTLAEGYREITRFAGLSEDGRRRKEMLVTARKLSGQDESAAFLWLYDEEKEHFHLDYYQPLEPERELKRLSIPCKLPQSDVFEEIRRITFNESRLNEWLKFRNLGNNREVFRVTTGQGASGYIQVVTPQPLSKEASELLKAFAEVVAARILRHRNSRRLKVYERLTELRTSAADPRVDDPTHWMQTAAQVAQEATSAKLALAFRQTPDLRLEVVAMWPNNPTLQPLIATSSSLVQKVFEGRLTKRILDHSSTQERHDTFQTYLYDKTLTDTLEKILGENLRSWIAAAVTSNNEAIAGILVANKNPDDYIPEVFSGTDKRLVENICNVLSRGFAQSHTTLAVRQISDFTSTNDLSVPEQRKQLLQLVQKLVPGIVAGAISSRVLEAESPDDEGIWELGGIESGAYNVLEAHMSRPLSFRVGDPQHLPPTGSTGKYFVYDRELSFANNSITVVLHLLSKRSHLAPFEHDVLKYLSTDLAQHMRSEQISKTNIENVIQIRHALRSGLQGVFRIDNALEIYEQIAKNGMQPSDLRVRILRTSLQWTKLFAERCRVLLEESRFLLGKIRREELRLGGASIVKLVKEIIQCLKPDSDYRKIEVNFQNDVKPNDEHVTIDHFLIWITVFNLIDNAIKYSHRYQTVHVTLESNPKEWALRVTDFGIHIRKSDEDAIFKTFVRKPTGNASETTQGTGLGLAVVKQVVDAHKGTIRVSSTPADKNHEDKGATVTFTLVIPR